MISKSRVFTDLRTNDQEQRLKQETNLETLRRIAAANSERESQLATIQKMDLLRQAQGRDPFLSPGGFQVPLTAPLGIPASDLARIACTVQETSGSGDPTTTGNIDYVPGPRGKLYRS